MYDRIVSHVPTNRHAKRPLWATIVQQCRVHARCRDPLPTLLNQQVGSLASTHITVRVFRANTASACSSRATEAC